MKIIRVLKNIIKDMSKMVPFAILISSLSILTASIWDAISPAILSVLLGSMSDKNEHQTISTAIFS